MYAGLTRDICATVFELCRPTIEYANVLDVTNKHAGVLIVLDPHTGDVLFEGVIQPHHEKNTFYRQIAVSKAEVSLTTGLPSRQVQQDAPHLYQPGMTKYGGSAVKHGLIVSFSGVQAVFDEAISWMILHWIIAMCQDAMTREDGVMASNEPFIGEQPPAQSIRQRSGILRG